MDDRVLFIEEDENIAAELSTWIAGQQFRIQTACSFKTAAPHLNGNHTDIVIADPYTPGGDGHLLLKRFKADNPTKPLIIVTAPENTETAMTAFKATVVEYLNKPINTLALDIALQHARQRLALNHKIDSYTQKLEDLHYAQNLYQQLFDEVPCYISVQDRNFRLTAMNRLFKRDFGNEAGAYCYKIYKHRDTPCPKCPVAKTFEDGRRHQTEEVVTSKHGKQYNVLTWTAPLRNDDDEITQVMEMATNITEVRRLQDHLTSLGLMLGSMSHGVKGMLTALDGGIYQLETGIRKKDNGRIELGFHRIQQSSARIRKMVLEILFYAKSRGMQHEATDVAELAEAVADAVKPMADNNGHTLVVDIASDAGNFEADTNWIQQSIVNFLENAVDACTDDTEKNNHRIGFRVYPQGEEMIVFDISDNGIGMDEETRQKMFTLFFSSKGSKGTGLGLFISNHIIRQHGGRIDVTSEYGKGTQVKISLPRFRTAESSIARPLLDGSN